MSRRYGADSPDGMAARAWIHGLEESIREDEGLEDGEEVKFDAEQVYDAYIAGVDWESSRAAEVALRTPHEFDVISAIAGLVAGVLLAGFFINLGGG